jgi:steroid delta-isomerase-like uncharacterized protein
MSMLLIAGVWGSVLAQTEEELIALHQAANEALNAHDVEQLKSFWTDDVVWDYVALGAAPANGKEEVAAAFQVLFQAFPDLQVTQRRVLAHRNVVVTECTVTGTHQGPWGGIEATGNPMETIHMDILEYEGDKCKRMTTYDETLRLMRQLGAMPPAGDPPTLEPSFTLPDPEPTGLVPVEAFIEQTDRFNGHDLSHYAKLMYPDTNVLVASIGPFPISRDIWVAANELFQQAYSDLRVEVVRTIDMGEGWVVSEVLFLGTHDGPHLILGLMEGTGRTMDVPMGVIVRADADGLITDYHLYYDYMIILAQMGIIPSPESTTVSPTSWGQIKSLFQE